MTATDRYRWLDPYAPDDDPPPRKPRPRLRNTCHYSSRVSVIRTTYPGMPWQLGIPGERPLRFATHDEAIHEAQRLANIRAVRATVDGAA